MSKTLPERNTTEINGKIESYNLETTIPSDEVVEDRIKIFKQISLPLLVAGFGMVQAGILLDHIKLSEVFIDFPELFILLPALLGLKGNLEMTMTSRLSSMANCGQLNDQRSECRKIYISNIALVQFQSIVIGLSAAVFSMMIEAISPATRTTSIPILVRMTMICATSILTASLTSLLLAGIMIMVIRLSLKYQINPDNVATPIAAALGDLVTMKILYLIATTFYQLIDTFPAVFAMIILASLSMIGWLARKVHEHPSTSMALNWNCWTPMFVAMLISSLSGWIFSFTVVRFDRLASYQPLVNGFGGNIAAIQASRLSSYLHWLNEKKNGPSAVILPSRTSRKFLKDISNTDLVAFLTRNDVHSRSAQTLLAIVIPFHLIFFMILNHFNHFHQENSVPLNHSTDVYGGGLVGILKFLLLYLSAIMCQVYILLYVTGLLIVKLWHNGNNPDNSSIPYLTSLGDLLGTIFLSLSFYIYFIIQ